MLNLFQHLLYFHIFVRYCIWPNGSPDGYLCWFLLGIALSAQTLEQVQGDCRPSQRLEQLSLA